MYEPTHEDGYWRMKVNKEKCNKFKYPDIVSVIQQQRRRRLLNWN